MNGREQPYIDANGVGVYEPTQWLDEVEGIQEGTPVDEQHLNNLESGALSASLMGDMLVEATRHQANQISNLRGENLTVTLSNASGDAWFVNTAQTVALTQLRDTLDYTVTAELATPVDNVGDIIIYDKQRNGFKVKYTGSAKSVSVKLYVQGGNAA